MKTLRFVIVLIMGFAAGTVLRHYEFHPLWIIPTVIVLVTILGILEELVAGVGDVDPGIE